MQLHASYGKTCFICILCFPFVPEMYPPGGVFTKSFIFLYYEHSFAAGNQLLITEFSPRLLTFCCSQIQENYSEMVSWQNDNKPKFRSWHALK